MHRAIVAARAERNPVAHGAPSRGLSEASKDMVDGLVAMLAILDRHREMLRKSLIGLVCRPLAEDLVSGLLPMVRSERREHIERFGGREEDLNGLMEKVEGRLGGGGGYLLVHAGEGFGKSGLVSALTDRLQRRQEPLGVDAPQVGRECPWIPGALLHMGKQSARADSFVPMIIAQANSLLLRPVGTSREGFDQRTIDTIQGLVPPPEPRPRSVRSTASGMGSLIERLAQEVEAERAPTAQDTQVPMAMLLHTALERLLEERGEAILVIDALDEISQGGLDLSFLPKVLPAGAVVVLTTRPGQKLLTALERHCRPRSLGLNGLNTDDAQRLLGVNDVQWVSRVWRETRGAPLYLRGVAEQVQRAGNHRGIDLSGGNRAVLQGQADLWRQEGAAPDRDPRHQALALLAVFEPVIALGLEHLQSWMSTRGFRLGLQELRELLAPVSGQLSGWSEDRLRLGVGAFGEYVRRSVIGGRDLRGVLSTVAAWLASDEDLSEEVISSWILYWTEPEIVSDAKQRDAAAGLVGELARAGRPEMLVAVYKRWWGSGRGREVLPAIVRACLEEAAAAGLTEAQLILGRRLLDGAGLDPDVARGEVLLREACEGGSVSAMVDYGQRLLDGRGVSPDRERGAELLERAVEAGSSKATLSLAERLLDATGVERDRVRGLALLKDLAGRGSTPARLSLALRRAADKADLAGAREALDELRALADEGEVSAAMVLGFILSSGLHGPELAEEGERRLRVAVNCDPRAALQVSSLVLDGAPLNIDKEDARAWLQRAAELGNVDAMVELGRRLCLGRGLSMDPGAGERWLRRGIAEGAVEAYRFLGARLTEDADRSRATEGRGILEFAAGRLGDVEAMYFLGVAHFLARGGRTDTAQAIRWLSRSSERGYLHAGLTLSLVYLDEADSSSGAKASRLQELARITLLDSLKRGHDLSGVVLLAACLANDIDDNGLPPKLEGFRLKEAQRSDNPVIARTAIFLEAVCLAAGFRCDVDWKRADQVMASFPAVPDDNDGAPLVLPFGVLSTNLLVGWLGRHHRHEDPEGLTIAERMQRARADGWQVPDWMDEAAASPLAASGISGVAELLAEPTTVSRVEPLTEDEGTLNGLVASES